MCPFTDRGEPRCATHWTLHNVGDAFRYCANRYTECPAYQQLLREMLSHEPADRADRALLTAS